MVPPPEPHPSVPTPKKKPRWVRWIIIPPIIFIILISVSLMILSLDTSHDLATQLINKVLAPQGHLTRLGGNWPFHFTLDHLILSDPRGTWLEAGDLELRWSLRTTRFGPIPTPRIKIRDLTLHRLPERRETRAPTAITLPSWPWAIDQLELQSMTLGKELLGVAATFEVTATATHTPEGDLHVAGVLQRRDRGYAKATLDLRYSSRTDHLELHASLDERSGLLAVPADIDPAGARWSARLDGSAPRQAWHGRLELAGPVLGRLTTGIQVADGHRWDLDGSWHLPQHPSWEPVRPWTDEGRLPFGITALIDSEKSILTLARLTTAIPGFTLDGQGQIPLDGQTIALQLQGQAPSLALFSPLAGIPLAGPLTLTATVSGAMTRPHWLLQAHSDRLAIDETTLEGLQTRWEFDSPLDQKGVSLTGSAHRVHVKPGYSGGLSFSGIAAMAKDHQEVAFRLRTRGTQWTGLPEAIAPWFDNHPRLLVKGRLIPERRLDLQRITLTATGVQGFGNATLHLAENKFSSSVQLQIADLTPLSRVTGKKWTGQVRLDAKSGGAWQDPWVELDVRGSNLNLPSLGIESITASFRGNNMRSAPRGRFETNLRAQRERLTLNTGVRWIEDGQTVQLDDLLITGPQSKVTGTLTTSLSRWSLGGRLNGMIASLSALKPWHGQEWEGRAEWDLDLAKKPLESTPPPKSNKGQPRRKGSPNSLDELKGHVMLKAFSAPGMTFKRLELDGQGNADTFGFSLSGQGRVGKDLSFTARGTLYPSATNLRLHLASLEGTLERERLRLRQPWDITWSNGGLATSNLDLTLAETQLNATLKQEKHRVEGECHIQGNLELLDRLDLFPIGGKILLHASLSGPENNPELSLTLRGKEMKHQGNHPRTLPPLGVVGRLQIKNGHDAHVGLDVSGLGQKPVQITGTLPVRWAFTPFNAMLLTRDPLHLNLEAVTELSDLATWSGLGEGQRLEGKVKASLQATGTLEHPLIQGTLDMNQGTYENADLGIVLNHIQVQGQADGRSLTFHHIRMSDGGQGTLQGQGQWWLDSEKNFPFQVTMNLDKATVVHREDTRANASGTLVLAGAMNALDLQGKLTFNQAEYQLKDFGSTPELRVVAIKESNPDKLQKGGSAPHLRSHIDIRLSFPDKVSIRGRGLESQWRGALNVQGSFQEPRIDGRLDLRRGHFKFVNKRYELQRGIIYFSGQSPPNPTMEIDAVTRSHDLEITANLEGDATRPRLRFTSVPELPENEILAQMLFGRAVESITPAQAIQLAATLQSLRNGGTGIVEGIGQTLGIDQLDFKGDSVETGTVNAGKYLSDKLYLEVQKGIKADSDRIHLEYDLTPELSLQTGVDARSNTDIGIMWNKDY